MIPTLLLKGIGLVKGIGFDSWRRVGPVMPAVKVYDSRDVDELIVLDIQANQDLGLPDFESISDLSQECFVPLSVGGGVTKLEHIEKLLLCGADKVTVNTAAYINKSIINLGANKFGSQCIVASIDVKKNIDQYFCYSHSGTFNTEKNPEDWARELVDLGAGEILLTSIDCDGTMAGYDLFLIERVAKVINVPLIASGGAGNYQHMIDAVNAGASAVAAASMFHFTEQTPIEAKKAMRSAGIPVRITEINYSNERSI